MRCRAALLAVLLGSTIARADDEAGALAHFRIGLDLVDRRAWDSALAEFLRSEGLHPTRAAFKNAALCLRELGRFDEALDAYEQLVTRFGSDAEIAQAEAAVTARIATLHVNAPTGATITIDGRVRDATKTIRVTAGAHTLRAHAEGYAPYESKVTVDAGASRAIEVRLEAVARVGIVRVSEARGRVFEVVVDDSVVGRTPWEGPLTTGEHNFALRGEGEEGTKPEPHTIELTNPPIVLRAVPLPGELRVEPTPNDARIYIDGRFATQGTFDGELPSGAHIVDLRASWSDPARFTALVSSHRPRTLRPALDRIRRFYIEAFGGAAFAPSLQASGVSGCDAGSCIGHVIGARVAFQVTPHFALGLSAALLDLSRQSSAPLKVDIGQTLVSFPRYEQTIQISTLLFPAISAEYQFLEHTPILLRLGTGTMYNSVTLNGGGASGSNTYQPSPAVSFSYFAGWIAPEVRFGYRVTRAVTVDLGVSAVFFLMHAGASTNDYRLPQLPFPQTYQGLAIAVPITFATRVFF